MKALIYKAPRQIDFCDAPEPNPAPGEVRVRVEAVGICGSDMHAYLGHDERRPAPLILGHEAAGIVEGGRLDGQRVTVNPLRTCADCAECRAGRENICAQRAILSMPPREGAFAEYITSPEALLIPVPDNISLSDACLVEPLACGWHAAQRVGQLYPIKEARCLIIGGGAIGVAGALALRAQGAQKIAIAETNALRRPALNALGDFEVFDPQTQTAFEAKPAQIIIDAVGTAQTREFACAHCAPGGVIAHIGLGSADGGVDVRRLTLQDISFIGCYTYSNQDFIDTAHALFDAKLGAINWTETRALADGHQAFQDILANRVAQPKIILTP